jgi:hypothetical protein
MVEPGRRRVPSLVQADRLMAEFAPALLLLAKKTLVGSRGQSKET